MVEDHIWHTEAIETVYRSLGSGPQGLSEGEAQRRLAETGPNELEHKKKASLVLMLLRQFSSFLIVLLIVAAIVSVVMGEVVDAVTIAVIVVLAGLLGFVQEHRAERALEALKQMAAPMASVIRGGTEREIPAREVAPGDVIVLRAGDRIPADARLVEAVNLQIGEGALTGESVPQEKSVEPIPSAETPVADRYNMAFTGTTVSYGRGKGVAVATGMATEFGKIAAMLSETQERQTPLQASLDKTGKWIGVLALVLCGLIAGFGVVRGYEAGDMFIWGVALAVAVIPEALPAVVTISLALGVRRMVKRHALIRKLQAVETLGCASVICSDKTGTLTRDEMTVRKIRVGDRIIEITGAGYGPEGEFICDGEPIDPAQNDGLLLLLRGGALCNDSVLAEEGGTWTIKGDPTEGALLVVAAKAGIVRSDLESQYPRRDEVPFSSETKRMTTVHDGPEGKLACGKGALEVILDSCNSVYRNGGKTELTSGERESILQTAQEWAGEAMRVLAIAFKPLPEDYGAVSETERDMVLLGLVGMIDPPRPEAREAIEKCKEAGVKPVMVTGDHKLTAVAIARDLEILTEGLALSGPELEQVSDQELAQKVEEIEVYARVSPVHKLRIVEAFDEKGYVVAMTGDGVNDAPALKRADIGVAMGIRGTDVSREAADMVLTDDNFASIVAAVEEGRSIFANIRKYLVYLLSGNFGAVIAMIAALLADMPFPITAVQILFINLIMDGAPAIALGVEPPEAGVMRQAPRDPRRSVFDPFSIWYILGVAVWIGAVTLLTYEWARDGSQLQDEKAMTMFFATLITIRLCNAFNCRSPKNSLFRMGVPTNKWLILATVSSFVLMLLVVYVPILQDSFDTVALDPGDWVVIIPVSLTLIVAVEIAKLVIRVQEKHRGGNR